ncbi:vacuolar sorting protein 39 [Actinidia rufa]|uniref:Vacuolar sorting protein 39 n=1 Tax=Actinidia rufa TaxID=165716 RepID=A0A7J0FS61_9ERIC|nr:vacuolar sorting protein 39 [Actinidia rufa]
MAKPHQNTRSLIEPLADFNLSSLSSSLSFSIKSLAISTLSHSQTLIYAGSHSGSLLLLSLNPNSPPNSNSAHFNLHNPQPQFFALRKYFVFAICFGGFLFLVDLLLLQPVRRLGVFKGVGVVSRRVQSGVSENSNLVVGEDAGGGSSSDFSSTGRWFLQKLGGAGGVRSNGLKWVLFVFLFYWTRRFDIFPPDPSSSPWLKLLLKEYKVLLLVDNVGVIVNAQGQPVGGSLVFRRAPDSVGEIGSSVAVVRNGKLELYHKRSGNCLQMVSFSEEGVGPCVVTDQDGAGQLIFVATPSKSSKAIRAFTREWEVRGDRLKHGRKEQVGMICVGFDSVELVMEHQFAAGTGVVEVTCVVEEDRRMGARGIGAKGYKGGTHGDLEGFDAVEITNFKYRWENLMEGRFGALARLSMERRQVLMERILWVVILFQVVRESTVLFCHGSGGVEGRHATNLARKEREGEEDVYCSGAYGGWRERLLLDRWCGASSCCVTGRNVLVFWIEAWSSVVRGAVRRTHGASTWVRHNHFDEARASCALRASCYSHICSSSKLRFARRETQMLLRLDAPLAFNNSGVENENVDVFLGVWAFEDGVEEGDVGRAFCRSVLEFSAFIDWTDLDFCGSKRGDRNTRFFHRMAIVHLTNNLIGKVCIHGKVLIDDTKIKDVTKGYSGRAEDLDLKWMVLCYRKVPSEEQIKDLLRKKNFQEAISLVEELQGEGEMTKEMLSFVHAQVGFLLLFDLHFEEAVNHFLLSETMQPSEVFPFIMRDPNRWSLLVPRNRYWGLHPPPAPLENVIDDGLMAVQRAVFLKKAGVETAVDDVFLLNPPNRADLLELAIENIIRYLHVSREKHLTPSVKEGVDTLLMYLYRTLNRVEDMERLATSENCCVVVCAILLLLFAFVAF